MVKVLVLNAGSSSQKSCLYQLTNPLPHHPPTPLWQAKIDWIRGQKQAEFTVKSQCGTLHKNLHKTIEVESRTAAIAQMLETLWSGETQVLNHPQEIECVGHRVVHGGQDYSDSVRITPDVKAAIAQLTDLAPAHNPVNLEGITVAEEMLGDAVPQVAVFDTAFHRQMPLPARMYPVPYAWFEQGIQRYGFHGISHHYAAQRTAQILGKDLDALRLITCHLGNGCSLTAVKGGRSIATTMGFTPLEGLMMGSRSGSIDPGILLHWLRRHDCAIDELERILNQESGLKGVSGVSNDLRPILEAIANGHERATLAFEMYIQGLRSQIGALIPTLGGLDALVFTGGVGEHRSEVRSAACDGFAFLGLHLDSEQNQHDPVDQDIATAESTVRVVVVKTQEEWAIAQACWQILQADTGHTAKSSPESVAPR